MKLDVAVDSIGSDTGNFREISRSLRASAAALGVLLLASPAMALDGIDLSRAPAAPAEGECPELIKIKYPFLSCANREVGVASGNDTWDNSRQIPIQSEFIEGNGYWGLDLNQD